MLDIHPMVSKLVMKLQQCAAVQGSEEGAAEHQHKSQLCQHLPHLLQQPTRGSPDWSYASTKGLPREAYAPAAKARRK